MSLENEKPEILIPSWLLFTVVGIWILAIPVVLFTVVKSQPSLSTAETLGTKTEQNVAEEPEEKIAPEEAEIITEKVVTDKPEVMGASKLVIGSQIYMVTICKEEFCTYIYDEDFKKLLVNNSLDEKKFNLYVEEKIKPFFEGRYGKTELVKNNKGEFVAKTEDFELVYSNIFDKVNSAYVSDLNNIKVDLDYKISAGTDGKYAEKYIEVDNSQQRLYVWRGGKVEKTILLSGPIYGWQVYGVFQVVDKGIEPIAPGGKYMPYWMAFYYSKKQDSWYGLHGLIWMKRDDGTRWIEPETNIGLRKSAGCIRMVVADAKYLYENFEKGDFILIHE